MSCRLPLWVALLALTVVGSLAQDGSTPDQGSTSSSANPETPAGPTSSQPASTSAAAAATNQVPTAAAGSTSPPTQATTTTLDPNAHSLQWIVLHAENPSGLLKDGLTGCTDFAFAGVQCTLSFAYGIKTSLISQVEEEHTDTFPYGNSADSSTIHKTSLSGDAFEGFELSGTLRGNDNEIAQFTFKIPSDQPKGILTMTDPTTGAAVKIAWKSGLKPPVTTVQPTTQQSTPAETIGTESTETTEAAGTGTTPVVTTQAPFYPKDCDDYIGTDRVNGARTIYIGGDPSKNIDVYCEFGTISGALTTIQSRGNGDTEGFSDDVTAYKGPFGTAGKGNNFWFGLDNMHTITSNGGYNLFIEVCCSGGSIQQQRYHNFSIGDSGANYTLRATPDTPGIGLDLKALGQQLQSDIGAPFTTKNTIKSVANIDPDVCEALTTYDKGYQNVIAEGSGGWWFGNCANNLNGGYIDVAKLNVTGKCEVTTMNTDSGTGVALRTFSGTIDAQDQTYLDHRSYTRVRMAIYKDPLQGISSTDFCSNS